MKTRFGLLPKGCFAQAAGLRVLSAGLPVRGADGALPGPVVKGVMQSCHGGSFALVPLLASSDAVSYYCLAAVVVGLTGVGIYRWAHRWRQRALKERDDETFRLADQWTKSLRQEVAERKEAERALQSSQEWMLRQERLAAVGQLAAGLAHEFNNIMTIIQGHASLLMENRDLDEESIKSLAIINDGVERTARLIKQMLAFSRKQPMQQKPLAVQEILGEITEMLVRLLGAQVLLRFEIAPRLPPILADPDMFRQIIVNLVVNARDAMRGGGQVTIRAALVTLAAADIQARSDRRPGPFIRLSVTDTGSGMDAATVNHLFEPFFTTKEVGKGTGLGLASVHGMVNQNQGWIEVESQVGKGATFDLYFPVTDPILKKAADDSAAPAVRGGKETVLIVEDETVLREMVREILENHGYHVLEAANSLQALHVWEQNQGRVGLLLTDNVLPEGMSGRDLAAKLREEAPRLPVILSSGYSQESLQTNGETEPGFSYLSKPYRPAQLIQAVRAALDAAGQPQSPLAAPLRQR